MNAKKDGANLDAATFDLDAWIDNVARPEVTIELYPFEAEHARRVAEIEALIPAAEKSIPENRGTDDPTPETLAAQMADLMAERSRSALKVRVRQLTNAETTAALAAARDSGADDVTLQLALIAAACVEPAFTLEQLVRLHARDRSGEHMVVQLQVAVVELAQGIPVPS